ncbi:hypothetical protein [Dinghuibacter silviterrae]|uniref:Uncharacterized protein n=1 Tax=Dinghuibacter silviterrae TaxID=1539049 RepID=A0A4V3GM58_9BACT|nr:hypothetical protein [Dinghuibacter silviterrae]TDX02133.1 hypothetical protein EDB95_3183 [Dinghuibacter silviterrae]
MINTIAGLELAQIGWVVPRVTGQLREDGYAVISEVDHPIARMAFFDTSQTMGVATEIMGITPEGWGAIEQMKNA